MADIEIISEKPITMSELKQELEKIKKRDKELNFRATRTEEYLQHFETTDKVEELFKKLESLKIPRLKAIHIIKIIDLMPQTVEELKVILQGYPITVNNDNLKKIADVTSEANAKK
jgi:DNA-directed RNA polymerase subunit F